MKSRFVIGGLALILVSCGGTISEISSDSSVDEDPDVGTSDGGVPTSDTAVPASDVRGDAARDVRAGPSDSSNDLRSLEVGPTPTRPASQDIALYLTGDSTVASYPASRAPLAGWGMPFVVSFQPKVRVLNRAGSGKSTRTFISDGAWGTVLKDLRTADYVFIQFGHNDENKWGAAYTPPADFKTNLIKFVTETRAKQAIPVLITPVSRRTFSGNTATESHPIYAPIVRMVAAEQSMILIDLDKLSIELNQQLGPEGSGVNYLNVAPGQYPAYPDGRHDGTHFCTVGARAIADLVLADIKRLQLELDAYQL